MLMLAEALEYLLTPCPRVARRLGYLYEVIAIKARHARCRKAWAPHLERTRSVLRAAMARCEQGRKAVILGSGMLLDVPLDELARGFRQVVLVDLVHPLGARWRRRRFANVIALTADVTNTAEALLRAAKSPGQPLPVSKPTLFLEDGEVDLVASVNLLSQLPYLPVEFLRGVGNRSEQAITEFSRGLIRAHLDYLRRLPGVVALVADVEQHKLGRDGSVVARTDTLHGIELPWRGEEWVWHLAPRPEAHPELSYNRRVIGVADIKEDLRG
jgi:hypothetical protein